MKKISTGALVFLLIFSFSYFINDVKISHAAPSMSKITWLNTDISGWKQTTKLSASQSGSTVTLNYDKSKVWPDMGGNINANVWIVIPLDGRYYAVTWEWLRPGQQSKAACAVSPSHFKNSKVSNWYPKKGETYHMMVSTPARGPQRTLNERSNLAPVKWTSDTDFSGCGSGGGGGSVEPVPTAKPPKPAIDVNKFMEDLLGNFNSDKSQRDSATNSIKNYFTLCQKTKPTDAEIKKHVDAVIGGKSLAKVKNEICDAGDGPGATTNSTKSKIDVECKIKDTTLETGDYLDISLDIKGGASPYVIDWHGAVNLVPGFDKKKESQKLKVTQAGTYYFDAYVYDKDRNSGYVLCEKIEVENKESNEKRYTQEDLDKVAQIMEVLKMLGIIPGGQTAIAPSQNVNQDGGTTTQISNKPFSGYNRDLKLGSTGEDVRQLQKYLNSHGFLVSATGAGSPGNETNYFGPATQNALIRFQNAKNISPASGYFGSVTRKHITSVVILN